MMSQLETALLGLMMIVIMFGMGASLTPRDFLIAFRKPQGILVGLLCQYGIMPALAFGLAMLLDFPPAIAMGLILMGCMPGGTTSNIFAYFSKGVLALSIMMTSVSTLVAVIAVPTLLSFYSGLAGIGTEFRVPASNVIQVLATLLVPTVLGMVLRRYNANVGATIEMIGAFLGVVVILFIAISWIPRNLDVLATTPFEIYFAAIGLGLIGIGLGFGFGRLLRQDGNRARTIALETGIQNGPLAILIVTLTFTGQKQLDVMLIPVLYSLFIVWTSAAVTIWFRRLAAREAIARDQAKVQLAGAGG
jgi:BASS family bile acid:Na+ symporter